MGHSVTKCVCDTICMKLFPSITLTVIIALASLSGLCADEPVYPFPPDQIQSAYSDGLNWTCTSKDGVTKSGSIAPAAIRNGCGSSFTSYDDGSPDVQTLHWPHGVTQILR
jgi:hypothetical protein